MEASAQQYLKQGTINKYLLEDTERKESKDKDITLKQAVSETYGKLAIANSKGNDCGIIKSCCGAPAKTDTSYSEELGYTKEESTSVPQGSDMGLGCGNPNAIAKLKAGETVLDLGSGGGFDCFLAAKRVGTTGKVIGVDMTLPMIEKARVNAQKGNYTNVEFRLGEIESLPVEDNSIDVIISNCVINLSTDKAKVFQEAARVLKPGGRLAISDIVATSPLPEQIKNDLELYAGCIAGAMAIDDLQHTLEKVGFENISIKIREASRTFIEKWTSEGSNAENYVASAEIEAMKPIIDITGDIISSHIGDIH
jgi:ubiquinone/menaquinone biosynthesis C-methylase UbiE